jgi:hypothetical protein
LIIKDLIKGDGAIEEVKELNRALLMKDDQIKLFKDKDLLKDQKISNLELIIIKKDEQFSLERQKSQELLKELKSQRRKTFLYKVGTFVAVITTSLLIVK